MVPLADAVKGKKNSAPNRRSTIRSGGLAPLLFYVHSIQIGYGYLAVLSWIFLCNMLVGVASPVGINIRSRSYAASWVTIHVMLAILTVVLGLFHGYIALYYK